MFSVRLVSADSYQATPLPQLDPTFSEFRGAEIKHVPVIRVFGTTPTGEKTCLHLHGVFPYMYVPFTGEENADSLAYRLAASLDAAINISLGSANSNTQHVYQIQRVAGIPFYGYHRREHQFFKISFYNPAMMNKAIDLLHNGSVLNQNLQPHEAHIPYILQFMMDYNVHGMSLINLSNVKHRRIPPIPPQVSETKPSNDSIISPVERFDYLPVSIQRQSTCQVEVDALVSDILNRQDLEKGIELNPGLAAIWEDERARRAQAGLPSDDSQLVNPKSPTRPPYCPTDSDVYQAQRLNRRLQMISHCDESTLSTVTNRSLYPVEVQEGDQLLNASNLGNVSVQNLDKSQQLTELGNFSSLGLSQDSKNSQTTHNSSILDAEDLPLVEMLMEMARDSTNQQSIDNDSVLGTQASILDNENKSDNEDEDIADLNLTCLELDSMSSWDCAQFTSPSQSVPVDNLAVNTEVPQTNHDDIFAQDTDNSEESEESHLPQLDGAGDLSSSFLESEEEESTTKRQEIKHVSECPALLLDLNKTRVVHPTNLPDSGDEAFIVEEILAADCKTSRKKSNCPSAFQDGNWSSYLPNEACLDQYGSTNYEALGSDFDADFEDAIGMSVLLSNTDETSIVMNLTVDNEDIPLEAVLNGDPCFTQTAEMDKSDLTELQDQYVSLLGSALVPDVYKNFSDNDTVNNHSSKAETIEKCCDEVSINSQSLRFSAINRSSSSSENVAPNIQEPDSKICNNKLGLSTNRLDRLDETCKDLPRLPSDNSDYNCNVVATWEELQDLKFIPKRVLKRKRFGRSGKRILTRCSTLSDSMITRRRGRFRAGLENSNDSFFQEDRVGNVPDSSSNMLLGTSTLEITETLENPAICERLMPTDHTGTTEQCSRNSWKNHSGDFSVETSDRSPPSSLSSFENDLEEKGFLPSDSIDDVQSTLLEVQYSTYPLTENESLVSPILADFEELIDTPLDRDISLDICPRNSSYYSSKRSHSGRPYGRYRHRHCRYSFNNKELTEDYVFTPDQIWVIEKRKRGSARALTSKVCSKNCRLPFVSLEKLDITKQQGLTMEESPSLICEDEFDDVNSSCVSDEIVAVQDDNSVDKNSDLVQSYVSVSTDIENSSKLLQHNNRFLKETRQGHKIDTKHVEIIVPEEVQSPVNDVTSTQSAQISSTQNHDQFETKKDDEGVVIRRVFEETSHDGITKTKKRSIILKLGNRSRTDDNITRRIPLLRSKDNKHPVINGLKTDFIQSPITKRRRGRPRKAKCRSLAGTEKISSKEDNQEEEEGEVEEEEKEMPRLRTRVLNAINQNEKKSCETTSMINGESNISSSQSEFLSKRPQLWCSIKLTRIDLTFMKGNHNEKSVSEDTDKSQAASQISLQYSTREILHDSSDVDRTECSIVENTISQVSKGNVDPTFMSNDDVSTNSEDHQFDDFDDSALNVHLCDSIYKDDVPSNDIFEGAEAISEARTSTPDGTNAEESEKYTNAVAEANFYAGKNYTIDAISQEIPQCLFEEDSNSESLQRKLSEAITDGPLMDEISPEKCPDSKEIAENSVNTSLINVEKLNNEEDNVLLPINTTESCNADLHDISDGFSEDEESFSPFLATKIRDLINEDESSNDECNYVLSRASSPEQLGCPMNCQEELNVKTYFDEEMIAKMMESIVVLREENKKSAMNDSYLSDETLSLEKVDDLDIDFANDTLKDLCKDIGQENEQLDNLISNCHKNAVTSASKYSPNKISIIRKIYLPKSKVLSQVCRKIDEDTPDDFGGQTVNRLSNGEVTSDHFKDENSPTKTNNWNEKSSSVDEETSEVNKIDLETQLEENDDNSVDSELLVNSEQLNSCEKNSEATAENPDANFGTNESEPLDSIETDTNDAALCEEVPELSEEIEIETIIDENCPNHQENTERDMPIDDGVFADEQNVINPDHIKDDDVLHESNNNRVIHRSDLFEVKENINATKNSIHSCHEECEHIEELSDSDSENNATDEYSQYCEIATVEQANEEPDNVSDINELPATNQYPEPKPTNVAVASETNLAKVDSNIEELSTETDIICSPQTHQSNEVPRTIESTVDSSEQSDDDSIQLIASTLSSGEGGIKSDILQSVTEYDNINHFEVIMQSTENVSTKVSTEPSIICRKVSIVLQRIDLNVLNRYLNSKKNLQSCDSIASDDVAQAEEKEPETSVKKKSVRFDEEVFIFEFNERVPLVDAEDREGDESDVFDEDEHELEAAEDEEYESIEDKAEDQELDQTLITDNQYSSIEDKEIESCNDSITEGTQDHSNDHDNQNGEISEENEEYEEFEPVAFTNDFQVVGDFLGKESVDTSNDRDLDRDLDKLSSHRDEISAANKKEEDHKLATEDSVQSLNDKLKPNEIVEEEWMQPNNVATEVTDSQTKNPTQSPDKAVNGVEMHQLYPDCLQDIHNTIDNPDKRIHDATIEDESSSLPVIELNPKPNSIVSAPLKPIEDPHNSRTGSRCKRKRTTVPTKQASLTFNNSMNEIPLINYSLQDNVTRGGQNEENLIVRTSRTLTAYGNKVHTVNIDERMLFTRVSTSHPTLMKKSRKERFLANIHLYPLKPRVKEWKATQTMTGSIQIQQPRVVLQRLTPSVLKYYGYTRRFKSNRYGKRFKTGMNRFTIPAYDGPADLSSSDSESDIDKTLESAEKRGCVYRPSKKKIEREAVVTVRKRSHSNDTGDDDDAEDEEAGGHPQKKRCTPKPGIASFNMPYRSPNRRSMLRSPGFSGRYSPLKIIVTSPKVHRVAHTDPDQSRVDERVLGSSCVTPHGGKRSLHQYLPREGISASSSAGQRGDNQQLETNVERQLGELKILDGTSSTTPSTKSPAAHLADEYSCESRVREISPHVRNTMNVRKNLFFSTEEKAHARVSSCDNAENIDNTPIVPMANPVVEKPNASTDSLHFNIQHNLEDQEENKEEEFRLTDEEDTTIFEQSTADIQLRYSPSILEDEDNEEEDVCNVTFTQYLNSQITKQPIWSADHTPRPASSQNPVTIAPKFHPPSVQRVIDTMETYNIPKCRHLQPFFSKQSDTSGQKELAHKMLKVPGKSLTDLPVFKSSLENITGLNSWRRMKVNEFHPSRGIFKSTSIRHSLAGHNSIVITPLLSPPSPRHVMKWIRARDYLRKQRKKEESRGVEVEAHKEKKSIDPIVEVEVCSNTLNSSIVEPSPEGRTESRLSRVLGRTPRVAMTKKQLFGNTSHTRTLERSSEAHTGHEASANSSTYNNTGEVAPSLLSILGKSELFKEIDQSKHLGISCGQIECLTNPTRSNVANENMQKAKALTRHQFITILCVEVHVVTREDLLPDPQHDSISALFYAIQSDVPPTSPVKPLEYGVITIAAQGESKLGYSYVSNVPFTLTLVANEEELYNTFIDLVTRTDPEIFIGWEIESLSWGYMFQRAAKLGLNLAKRISRIPGVQCKWESKTPDSETLAEIKLPGRIVLDIWRIMRSEIALLTYTFENVMYHVMNERLSCPSFKTLTNWWGCKRSRWKVVQHYGTKVLGVLRMLEQLDIIGRTSELARLFGIQFYEVFSRGSQYRVESIMLRLAKPLNYIPVSPSPQQRACMRAMEALPLIMEPESLFYSDPVIVLDFQSLYPSIIIAHNYCFSTCLGRVEHIGQPEPFEFGATVLRVPKSTALRLQGKVNYSPSGVAFVKPEVRQGILPRMLTEILETRFMVKKAMKDHSQDDKLLQRVLHSRQLGLKYLANVTYGYTAANFSGRMPCIELGDSVISKSKETLERAIKLVESTPKWGARVVYGDTDSLFILVPGKSKDDAFKVGYEIADAVTASNLSPIKLKFEKILYPAILQTKKRYCGYMYETPDQKEPKYLAKGIETVRRDGCPAVSKILEKTLKILFDTKDVSQVKNYVTRQLDKVLHGKVSIQDLTFAKEFRGLKGYRERACVPALELTRRLMKKDPRAVPRHSERVRYVIVAGAPNQALIHCVRSPWEVINDPGLRPNGTYYVTRVIIPPLNRCLNLMGVDVNTWYREMPHRQVLDNPVPLPSDKQKQTIFQYFGTIVCVSCGRPSNRGICTDCVEHPSDTLVVLHEKLRWLERINDNVTSICQSCVGRGDIADCVSLDCPVLYRRAQAQRELSQGTELQRIIEAGRKLEF